MPAIAQIKKRNGSIADFDLLKIQSAIRRAFIAVRGEVSDSMLGDITDVVNSTLQKHFGESERTPSVENVQDLVERIIMEYGFYDVAKAYIIYRYQHQEIREEQKKEVLEKLEKEGLQIKKKSGEVEPFSINKIKKTLGYAAEGLPAVDIEAIANQAKAELYDEIETKDIQKTLVWTTRSMIEQDPDYSKMAARLLHHMVYKEVIGADIIDFKNIDQQYRESFVRNIKRGVEVGRLDSKILDYDLDGMATKLVIERDDLLIYLGAQTLYDRYFIQEPETGRRLETPQMMWMRVALGLAINEREKEQWATKFYTTISQLHYVPSTPTLFHSGTRHPQLSSCYLNTVKDSLDHIFKVYADNAQLSKWSGGIGTDWTDVRATGAPIKGTGVESQGTIPFLKIANDVTVAINRSGRRRGAACVYLEVWHADIEDFIELRKNTGDERRRTHDMNTANWVPDLFMKRVKENGDWTLFSPNEVPELHHTYGQAFEEKYMEYEKKAEAGELKMHRKIKAVDLWRKMMNMIYETGHPWVTFKDSCNVRSPQDHVGVIHNSNLCTEITLNTSGEETAVCNLGSVNLSKHITNGQLDEARLGQTVTTAMRMLDNVVDINFYPTIEAKNSNLKHRPVGLGVMGFQDALYLQNIRFDSDECVEFADRCQESVAYFAYLASSKLAEERGAYVSYKGSKWDRGILPQDTIDILEQERGVSIDVPRTARKDWSVVRESIKQYGMRNSNCLAIAPTATISNISGCSPTIEPIYSNIYVKANVSGDFTVVNTYLVNVLKAENLWDTEMLGKIKYNNGSIQNITEIPQEIRERFKEVFEISPRWLVKAGAYRGRWVDQSQSLNIFYRGTSGKEISDIYQYAWEMGLKTTYYLRTLAASGVEKSTVNTAEYGKTHIRDTKEPVEQSQNQETGQPQTVREQMPQAAPAAAMVSGSVEPEPPLPTQEPPVAPSFSIPVSDVTFEAGARASQQLTERIITTEAGAPAIDQTFSHAHGPNNDSEEPTIITPEGEAKLCRIDDPDCEACQ